MRQRPTVTEPTAEAGVSERPAEAVAPAMAASCWLESPALSVEEQLALDEALLDEAERGLRSERTVRTWMAGELAVVVGSSSRLDTEVDLAACRADGVRVVRTVDPGGETDGWDGKVGLLPNVFEELGLAPENRIVVACGPPIMLHYLFLSLEKVGYSPDQVVTTLENKMKCGIGHCGRCFVGPFSVCRDGPVVTWAELNELPKDY